MKKRNMFLFAILLTVIFCSINVFAGEIINHGTGEHRFRFDFEE